MGNQSITAVRGFKAAALHCGIKQSGKPDLALLVSDVPATAAAVFTTNKVVGAPVIIGRRHIRKHVARACITNSGCANVCTGDRGLADAFAMCHLTAASLVREGETLPISQIFPFSTGVIGHYLPMEKLRVGIPHVVAALSSSAEAGDAYAHAILTTDTRAKMASTSVTLGGKRISVAGCCKGSGMIAPNMATMLAYVATDAAIDAAPLQRLVQQIADVTFNAVTVDQHTSTSDTFIALANGVAGNRKLTSANLRGFAAALLEVCDSLARQIAADGEGATKLVKVRVTGAASSSDAKLAAMAIANSPLVKTAIHGGDPNWGRFVSAAGYSGARMNVRKSSCRVGPYTVFKQGRPALVNLAHVERAMQVKELDIAVHLGFSTSHQFTAYTCDLSREYIRINADYHT